MSRQLTTSPPGSSQPRKISTVILRTGSRPIIGLCSLCHNAGIPFRSRVLPVTSRSLAGNVDRIYREIKPTGAQAARSLPELCGSSFADEVKILQRLRKLGDCADAREFVVDDL